MDISVVIPAYNEAAVIGATVRDVLAYLKKKFSTFEIVVVDDGSRDHTAAAVPQHPVVRCIIMPDNRGKGFAVKTGVRESAGELILFMDADNSTNIRELDHFMTEMRSADIVIGSRALKQSSIPVSQNGVKRMLGRIGNRVIQFLMGLTLSDTRCGFKLFRASTKTIFERLTVDGWAFDDEILFLAKQRGLRIVESPVTWVNNFDSKVTPLTYVTTIIHLLAIRWRHRQGATPDA